MSQTTEYAKLVRVTNGNTTDRGFQANIKLPVYKDLTREASYFAIYCGLTDVFECGLSTKLSIQQNGIVKWHWFVNSPDGNLNSDPYNVFYSDGSTVHISLERNANDKIVFKVNGSPVFTSTSNFSAMANTVGARLVFSACQEDRSPNNFTPPLPTWDMQHSKATASGMKYMNSSGNWVNMTDPNKATAFHWPINITPNPPVDYTMDKSAMSNATISAAIGRGDYILVPQPSTGYTVSRNSNGIQELKATSRNLTYFTMKIYPVKSHPGLETAVFVHDRNFMTRSINAPRADYDIIDTASAGFSTEANDVVRIFLVDELTNSIYQNPVILGV